MIPERFAAYSAMLPWIHEVTDWSLLRKWALSEVYRVQLPTGDTRILKWGGGEMAREADIYQELVHPLRIAAPQIFEVVRHMDSVIFVMEDAGMSDVEQHPEQGYFIQAARELARIRVTATANLGKIMQRKVIEVHLVTSSDFLLLLDQLARSPRIADNTFLLSMRSEMPDHIEELYRTVPMTIVHQDYHAKNLLIQPNGGIMPIDWSNAYVSPHLGDLYCLMSEARNLGHAAEEDIISAFLEGSHLHADQLRWQVRLGGLCWLIKTLHWVVYRGADIIPGSEAWVPDLLQDVEDLAVDIV